MKYNSIAGIALKSGKVLVMKRLPKGALANKWEFPGGKLEEGESVEEAMTREWLEELEVPVRIGELLAQTEFRHGEKQFLLHSYRVFPEHENWVFHEHSQAKWVSPEELMELDLADSDRNAAKVIFSHILKS